MIARALALTLGTCGTSPAATPSEEPLEPEDEQRERSVEPDDLCTMKGQMCPSDALPRVSTELTPAAWKRVRADAKQSLAAVALEVGTARLVETCDLPGSYVEVARDKNSPGRAWAATRLVFVPEEAAKCEGATHVLAAFAIRDGAEQGEAIALPLPCKRGGPCLEASEPDARRAAADKRFGRVQPATERGTSWEVLHDLFAMVALLPERPAYLNLATHSRFLDRGQHGGCFLASEAEYAAHQVDPEFASSDPPRLHRESNECRARPSFATCFPDAFVPGEGVNCW